MPLETECNKSKHAADTAAVATKRCAKTSIFGKSKNDVPPKSREKLVAAFFNFQKSAKAENMSFAYDSTSAMRYTKITEKDIKMDCGRVPRDHTPLNYIRHWSPVTKKYIRSGTSGTLLISELASAMSMDRTSKTGLIDKRLQRWRAGQVHIHSGAIDQLINLPQFFSIPATGAPKYPDAFFRKVSYLNFFSCETKHKAPFKFTDNVRGNLRPFNTSRCATKHHEPQGCASCNEINGIFIWRSSISTLYSAYAPRRQKIAYKSYFERIEEKLGGDGVEYLKLVE